MVTVTKEGICVLSSSGCAKGLGKREVTFTFPRSVIIDKKDGLKLPEQVST